MASLAQLTDGREALMAARYPGFRSVEYDDKRVGYATDVKMAAALGDLNRQIAATGPQRISVVRIQTRPTAFYGCERLCITVVVTAGAKCCV